MSDEIYNLIWHHYPAEDSTEMVILLRMAMVADDYGNGIFLSNDTLANAARIDEKTLGKILDRLKNQDIIAAQDLGRRVCYHLNIANIKAAIYAPESTKPGGIS